MFRIQHLLAAIALVLLQVKLVAATAPVQLQPEPDGNGAAKVSPVGRVSATVYVPVVVLLPKRLLTLME